MPTLLQPKTSDYIRTYTGTKFWPIEPNEEDIFVEDIAWSLSMQVRFAGHVKKRISVAQHSIHVSELSDRKDALWGLMHDGSEAYLVDFPTPLKKHPQFSFYTECETRLMNLICKRFRLPKEMPASVHRADRMMLVAEDKAFRSPIDPEWSEKYSDVPEIPFELESWDQITAYKRFMKLFEELASPGVHHFAFF